jgi:asparagine synthase (glutamine-hydrolysing)
MARQHVTVALSGDGGDEMLGGYTRHAWSRRVWNPISAAPRAARRAIGSAIQLVPKATWNTIGRAVPGARISKLGDKAHKLAHWLTDLDSIDDLYRMLATTWPIDSGVVLNSRRLPTLLDVEAARRTPLGQVEQEMMFWDTLTYLPDDILHKVDRAAMGVSLETRAPFLDHRVAELAWRFPLHMKIRQGEGKWILRRLLSKYVPAELIERPKMGFGVPIDSWLRGPLRGWAEDLMDTSRLQSEGFFNEKVVRERWTEHLAGTANWQYELWAILMFQAWLD